MALVGGYLEIKRILLGGHLSGAMFEGRVHARRADELFSGPRFACWCSVGNDPSILGMNRLGIRLKETTRDGLWRSFHFSFNETCSHLCILDVSFAGYDASDAGVPVCCQGDGALSFV